MKKKEKNNNFFKIKRNIQENCQRIVQALMRFYTNRTQYRQDVLPTYNPDNCIAVLWGVDKDKISFFENFFEENQLIFVNKTKKFRLLVKKERLHLKKMTFYVFGHNAAACKFAKQHDITVCQLGNGLIGHPAEAKLTASFLKNTDLAGALKNSSFKDDEVQLNKAAQLRTIYKALHIGYGNAPGFIDTKKLLGPKIRKRVLILPSAKKGNVFKRAFSFKNNQMDSIEGLLALAISEHPDAEIYLYNSCVAAKYELAYGSVKIDNIRHHYTIITRSVRSTDMIAECDHIYTDKNLAAIDALIYDKKLTVTGKPFYCGWGLTDDRAQDLDLTQKRVLTLDEFFGIVFLENTRYASDDGDSVTGLLSTLFEVFGAYQTRVAININKNMTRQGAVIRLGESEYWPVLLHLLNKDRVSPQQLSALSTHLGMCSKYPFGQRCNFAISAALIGLSVNRPHFKTAMVILKKKVPTEDIIIIFQQLIALMPSATGLKEIEIMLEGDKNWDKCYEILAYLLNEYQLTIQHQRGVNASPDAAASGDHHLPHGRGLVDMDQYDTEYKAAVALKEMKRFDLAGKAFYKLLLSGILKKDIFIQLAELASIAFEFQDAANLYHIATLLDTKKQQGSLQKQANSAYIIGDCDNYSKSMLSALYLSPTLAVLAGLNNDIIEEKFGRDLPYEAAFLNVGKNRLSTAARTDADLMSLADTYMVCGQFEKQVNLLQKIRHPKDKKQYYLSLMNGYIFMGDYQKAQEIGNELLFHYPGLKTYQAAVKLAIRMGDCAWADHLFQQASMHHIKKNGVIIDEISFRKYNLIKQNIDAAYKSYRDIATCRNLVYYFNEKYIQSATNGPCDSLLILAYFGPGDEIRFASLYAEMQALFPGTRVAFTCEPRLYDLLQNSYPALQFIPVARQRKLSYRLNMDNYTDLPSSQLHDLFDNHGWAQTQHYSHLTLVTDLLGDLIQGKQSINGKPYLVPLANKKQFWAERVKSQRIKIGLSWRSSLVTYARSEHYLTIDDLGPLINAFGDEVEFFNLQYDSNPSELTWVKENCHTELTHFEDLDQYNDLSSVAGLMSCMDLMIAPATTVVELAGALGCPTLLISNSPELHWRKVDELTRTDVWHQSVTHVEGESADKSSIVSNLIKAVAVFVSERSSMDKNSPVAALENL